MTIPPRWKSLALASAAVLATTACASDNNDSDPNEDNETGDSNTVRSVDNEMADWEVDCDWFELDEMEEFLEFDNWDSGPTAINYGDGDYPERLSCEGKVEWPEFEVGSGHTQSKVMQKSKIKAAGGEVYKDKRADENADIGLLN